MMMPHGRAEAALPARHADANLACSFEWGGQRAQREGHTTQDAIRLLTGGCAVDHGFWRDVGHGAQPATTIYSAHRHLAGLRLQHLQMWLRALLGSLPLRQAPLFARSLRRCLHLLGAPVPRRRRHQRGGEATHLGEHRGAASVHLAAVGGRRCAEGLGL